MPMTLQLENIEGNSQVHNFTNWIDLADFCIGGIHTNSSPSSTRASLVSGSAEIGPLTFSKLIDSSSPKLWTAMSKGKVLAWGEAVATANNSDPDARLVTYKFEGLRVVSLTNVIDMRNGGKVEENVAMSFRKLTIQVPGLNGAAQIVFEYDSVYKK